jgi:nucleoside-diphosphate-sugar epimerase
MSRVLVIGGNGYIGSYVTTELLNGGHYVDVVDLNWFVDDAVKLYPNQPRLCLIQRDYSMLSAAYLWQFDCVILLAGHSSVGMCGNDPKSSMLNNVENFIDLCGKLGTATTLIYASSASVYDSIYHATERRISDITRSYYDLTKKVIDGYAQLLMRDRTWFGLRFGTVCGVAPVTRTDVIVNAMVLAGLRDGIIPLFNPRIRRSLLGLGALYGAIDCIIKSDHTLSSGVYNLASVDATPKQVANAVASALRSMGRMVDVNLMPSSESYDFTMDCGKAVRAGILPQKGPSLRDIAMQTALQVEEGYAKIYGDRRSPIAYSR